MEWILCKDRMPTNEEYNKNDGRFIVTDGNKSYQRIYDRYDSREFVEFDDDYNAIVDNCVVAWCEFPKPYKVELSNTPIKNKLTNLYYFDKEDVEIINDIIFDSKKSNQIRCNTCKNNPKNNDGYCPPHTCDICTSLDTDDYYMWEELNEVTICSELHDDKHNI